MSIVKILSTTALSWGLLMSGAAIAADSNVQTKNEQGWGNHSGSWDKITPEQRERFKEHNDRRLKQEFDKMDTNHDGKVDRKEYDKYSEEIFKKIDNGNKGYLTLDDVKNFQQEQVKEYRDRQTNNVVPLKK